MKQPQVMAPTFEHHREALGIGEAKPRLSFRVRAEPSWVQTGYEVELVSQDAVDRTAVAGAESVLVPWPGAPLASRQRAEVRVRVRGVGADGVEQMTSWSPVASVEAGLLDPDDWMARPVGPDWEDGSEPDTRPPLLRRSFLVDGQVAAARLYVTAHGVFEAELNGARIGTDELAPGWTSYGHRLRYSTFDVTSQVRSGENVLGAWLGDGWYRGRLGFKGGRRDLYGRDVSLLAQLEVRLSDGRIMTVATDETWRATTGPIQMTSLYDGERYDARELPSGWSSPGYDDSSWQGVRLASRDPATLVAPDGPSVRCTEELRPVDVWTSPSGRTLVDFGQNLVGRLRITVRGKAGDVVVLRHAEVLQDGELCTRPLRDAQATDQYTVAGTGEETWEPRFTIHGFRYAEITGWTGADLADNVVARVLHTDMVRTGAFQCSDERVNRLHENVRWSMRGNFVDVPTDCPQRDERLGWTGDIQVFSSTAAFLYDCTGMLRSWLADLACEQRADGTVPWFVPDIPVNDPMWTPVRPGAVWGDAAVLIPWDLYEASGDRRFLEDQWTSARAWVDLVDARAGADHVWEGDFQLGDWLDPAAPPDDPAAAVTDPDLVATAYFARSAGTLSRMAGVLGRREAEEHYATLADAVTDAFRDRYVRPGGRLASDTQTAYALAICFDLLPAEEMVPAGERLAELVASAGNRIATGFAGTPLVTEALTRTGQLETAYALLLEEECPSWLYAVKQGATTVWERWDSLLPSGAVNPGNMTSFNHYAFGAVAGWLHRSVAGLAPAQPGWRAIRFAPRPGGAITAASASYETPYGPAAIAWELDGARLDVRVDLPTGTSGSVDLPGDELRAVGPGTHHFSVVLEDVGSTAG